LRDITKTKSNHHAPSASKLSRLEVCLILRVLGVAASHTLICIVVWVWRKLKYTNLQRNLFKKHILLMRLTLKSQSKLKSNSHWKEIFSWRLNIKPLCLLLLFVVSCSTLHSFKTVITLEPAKLNYHLKISRKMGTKYYLRTLRCISFLRTFAKNVIHTPLRSMTYVRSVGSSWDLISYRDGFKWNRSAINIITQQKNRAVWICLAISKS